MAVSPLKRKQVRIYLDDDDDANFSRLMAEAGKLSEASVMSLIVHAGLKAIEANGFRVELPLRLVVVSKPIPYALNEKTAPVPCVPSPRR
jgi:hypothetical protein